MSISDFSNHTKSKKQLMKTKTSGFHVKHISHNFEKQKPNLKLKSIQLHPAQRLRI